MNLALQVEMAGLDAVLADVDLIPAAVDRAVNRAQGKTARFAANRLADLLSADTGIDPRALKPRVKRGKKSVWLGYNPVAAAYAGRLSQDERGAWAGQYYFDGAFVATMPSGHRGIFQRQGKARLPIHEQTVSLAGTTAITEKVRGETEVQFAQLLREELSLELNAKGGAL